MFVQGSYAQLRVKCEACEAQDDFEGFRKPIRYPKFLDIALFKPKSIQIKKHKNFHMNSTISCTM
jgi:hypothetical protein